MRRTAALLLAVLACCVPAAVAPASPVPSGAAQIGITTTQAQSSVWFNSANDCILLDGGWNPDGGSTFLGVSFQPRGLLDVPAGRGEVIVPGQAIHMERIFTHPPRALGAMDVGIQLAGRRAYLTGTIRGVRATSARSARRLRLARLTGVKIVSKANQGHLLVSLKAHATMLPALAGTLERLRCKGGGYRNRPIRSGQALGTVTAAIDPARATALAGSFSAAIFVSGDTDSGMPVFPTGGAQQTGSGAVQFAWAPGTRVPATCGTVCLPSGGTIPLVGGFDLVQGVKRLSFTDLSIAAAGTQYSVSATVAGARHVIATGPLVNLTFTADGNALLASTFADPTMTGELDQPLFMPTRLAPA